VTDKYEEVWQEWKRLGRMIRELYSRALYETPRGDTKEVEQLNEMESKRSTDTADLEASDNYNCTLLWTAVTSLVRFLVFKQRKGQQGSQGKSKEGVSFPVICG